MTACGIMAGAVIGGAAAYYLPVLWFFFANGLSDTGSADISFQGVLWLAPFGVTAGAVLGGLIVWDRTEPIVFGPSRRGSRPLHPFTKMGTPIRPTHDRLLESLGEDLILLGITRKGFLSSHVGYGLMGSEALRLAVRGRVDLTTGRIKLLDSRRTGDERLDSALRSIAGASKPPRLSSWIKDKRPGINDEYAAPLIDQGTLGKQRVRVLRFFWRTDYTVLDDERLADARTRIDDVAYGAGPVDPDHAALASLVWATRVSETLYPGWDKKQARRRLKEVSRSTAEGSIEADAVRRVAEAVYASVPSE